MPSNNTRASQTCVVANNRFFDVAGKEFKGENDMVSVMRDRRAVTASGNTVLFAFHNGGHYLVICLYV